MNATYRQIARHAGIFGAGAILSRLASIVLLPLYTRHLRPTDYGIMALLDVTINVLAIMAGAGIGSAATRAHFADNEHVDASRVWWTAILCETAIAGMIVMPALALRARIATVVFGPSLTDGPSYVALALTTLWVTSITTIVDSYFRARKASAFIVGVGLGRLLINVALNVLFLVWYRMGVAGVLWGNLISAVVAGVIECAPFLVRYPRAHFEWALARRYWSFGSPLIIFGLCSVAMHEADRYVLRLFVDLRDLGLYSLAYQIGQGANTLFLMPFSTIWSVLIYEIAREPDAAATYAKVFKLYVYTLSLVLLGAALFSRVILRILAPPEYAAAGDLVPIVCLAYFFFSLHDHFKVPALLASRTTALLPAVFAAAVANIGLNFLMIPRMGVTGAAWASVATFALFSGIGLVRNRRIERYPYPFGVCTVIAVGMCGTYVLYREFSSTAGRLAQVGSAATLWVAWAAALFGANVTERLRALRSSNDGPRPSGDLAGPRQSPSDGQDRYGDVPASAPISVSPNEP